MLTSTVHPCPHCGVPLTLRGLRLYVPVACPACGGEVRGRERIDGFQLLKPLGRGAFSSIFLALDVARGETVALKLFQPPSSTEREDIDAFIRDTIRLMEVDHPNVAKIQGAGEVEGMVYVARQWLSQGSLAARILNRGRFPQDEALELAYQAAAALDAASAAGLLHRDVEPGNLIFSAPGTIKVTDFGQAVFFDRAAEELGTIWGRFSYVPPERLRQEPEDIRSDMYALGATLLHALTGSPPYQDESNGEILLERIETEPLIVVPMPKLIHAGTAALLNRMLSPDPEKRHATWREVMEEIERAHAAIPKAKAPVPVAPPASVAASVVARSPAPVVANGVAEKPKLHPGMVAGIAACVALVLCLGIWKWPKKDVEPERLPAAASADATPKIVSAAASSGRSPKKEAGLPTADWRFVAIDPAYKGKKTVSGKGEFDKAAASLALGGTGDGIRGKNDAHVFQYIEASGEWTLVARVKSLAGAEAGLVVRDGLDASARCLAIVIDGNGKVAARIRKAAKGPSKDVKTAAGPKQGWVRLSRRGDVFEAKHSKDGKAWTSLAKLTLAKVGKTPAGFVVAAGKADAKASAEFDRLSYSVKP